MKPSTVTVSQLADLPPTLDLMTAAQILGLGRTKAYELAKNGEFPCRIIKIGDTYRIPTPDLIRLLQCTQDHNPGENASPRRR